MQEQIAEFLHQRLARKQENRLEMAAHLSLAFAAGYELGTLAGYDITVRQRHANDLTDWNAKRGEVPKGRLWGRLDEEPLSAGGEDVVLVVEVTQEIR